jgi:hypothetical protein
MPHLGAFVPSNYFAFIYVPVYRKHGFCLENLSVSPYKGNRLVKSLARSSYGIPSRGANRFSFLWCNFQKLTDTFEDVMSGRKSEKDRPSFAAMLKAAHQRKFDILVFWALDRLTREGTRATLNYLQRLESKALVTFPFRSSGWTQLDRSKT